jgi:hypothetical protein
MADFLTFFSGPQAASFYGFLLPWLFSFAIVFGLLTKAKLFGDASQKVNVALAFVIAFFVTGLGGPTLASFFVNFFGGSAIFLAGILVFLLFLTLLGGEKGMRGNWHTGTLGFIFIVIVAIVLFLSSQGTFAGFFSLNSDTTSLIFWLVIIIIAAYMITKGGGSEKAEK